MAAGSIRWSGTFTLPASGPGVISSVDVSVSSLATSDRVVCTPASTASQRSSWVDVNGSFQVEVVKSSGSFTAYADREQLPDDVTFDYIVLTNST